MPVERRASRSPWLPSTLQGFATLLEQMKLLALNLPSLTIPWFQMLFGMAQNRLPMVGVTASWVSPDGTNGQDIIFFPMVFGWST